MAECSKRSSYSSKTLEFKRMILLELEKGIPAKVIAQREGLPKSTISTWLKNKLKILSDTHVSSQKDRKRKTFPTKKGVDKALLMWFKRVRNVNMPVNGPLLLTKANQFAQEMKTGPVSKAWIDRWKIRYGIGNQRFVGESGRRSKSTQVVSDWKCKANKLNFALEQLQYKTSGDYNVNMDETTDLFYGRIPNSTLHFKEENCEGGKQKIVHSEDETEDSTNSDDFDNKPVNDIPTYNQFSQSLDVVRRYLESQPNTEKLLEHVDNIDKTLSASALKQRKH